MRIDLWVPTANPFTTPELLAVIGAEAEQRGIGTIWVGEHVVLFEEYASSYPYAEDGRIPAPAGTGLLEPLSTPCPSWPPTPPPCAWVRPWCCCPSATRCTRPRRSPPWTGCPTAGWTSGSAWDGWRRSSTRSTCRGPSGAGGPTSTSRCSAPCGATRPPPTRVSSTRSTRAPCSPSRSSPPSPDPHRRGVDAALARVARAGQGWHTFNRAPEDLAEPLATLDGLLAEKGRSRATYHHRLPVLPAPRRRHRRPLRRRGRGRGGRVAPPLQRR